MPSRYSSFDIEAPNLGSPLKKFSRVSNLVASCLMCLFAILNIIILFIVLMNHSFSVDTHFSELIPLMDFISGNLNTPPISNIVLANNKTCPKGYGLQTLTTWPGTTKGCYCPQRGYIYPGECAGSDKAMCLPVDPTDPQDLFEWNDDLYCIARTKDYVHKSSDGTCAAGYSPCREFCVKEGQLCPVTGIKVITKGSEEDATLSSAETLELSDDRTLVISRDPTNPSLSDISVSFYGKPCLQPNYIPPKENGLAYTLLDIPSFQGCGSYGSDEASVIVESQNVSTFIHDNKLTPVEQLPLYLDNEVGAQVHLVSRPRLTMSESEGCSAMDVQSLALLKEMLGSFKKMIVGATLFPLILFIIYLLYLVYLLFDEGLKKFYKKATRKWLSWILFTGCFAVIIGYNLYLSSESVELLGQQQYYAGLAASNCFGNPNVALALGDFAVNIPIGIAVIMSYANTMFWASIVLYVATVIVMSYKFISNLCD